MTRLKTYLISTNSMPADPPRWCFCLEKIDSLISPVHHNLLLIKRSFEVDRKLSSSCKP